MLTKEDSRKLFHWESRQNRRESRRTRPERKEPLQNQSWRKGQSKMLPQVDRRRPRRLFPRRNRRHQLLWRRKHQLSSQRRQLLRKSSQWRRPKRNRPRSPIRQRMEVALERERSVQSRHLNFGGSSNKSNNLYPNLFLDHGTVWWLLETVHLLLVHPCWLI
jgi:hypothetical protein